MTSEEFQTAFRTLVGPDTSAWPTKELSHELDVPWQDIRKAWRNGCTGGLAKAMELAASNKRKGIPWRKNEVAIAVRDGKFVLDLDSAI